MIKQLFRFLYIAPVVCIAFIFQWLIVDSDFHPFLIRSYAFNLVLGIIFLIVYLAFKSKISLHLGYYFLYFSLLKFLLFFILVYPGMDRSEGLRSPSFLAFFAPYVIFLIHEIVFVTKEMNKR